ncbi:hypothetical protein [Amycolatopsis methanolica]|uniref:Uncharacterized protein n=1 Tax=Amycolatopsis methanolica 239 TaxID=1068978 RepID=A0A076N4B6_AMYME|nr:hypothetical protein [Amycolatopsis methanolica]AIJ26086.1 hypothetical protein AMETH_5994 [Amycolatopsis methanolica 239]
MTAEQTQEILAAPLPDADLAAEVERAGRPVGKVTLALVALVLLAAGFAGGVWVGSSAGGSSPAAGPQQTQQTSGRVGGFPGGQGGFQPGTFNRG